MKPSEKIKEIESLMTSYRIETDRSPMQDMATWHTINYYATFPDDYDIVWTSTQEEAFDRMVADKWSYSYDFYGLDYEIMDELVLEYLKKNALVKDVATDD